MHVRVQEEPFDLGTEVDQFIRIQDNVGAVVTFSGVVRDTPAQDLDAMEIEHYPAMAQAALEDIATQALNRWSLADVIIIHRFGRLTLREAIMMVGTAAPHRQDAFAAAAFLMDYLKSRAPFWKKELRGGRWEWVSSRTEDAEALARW
ncbi:MAG: molybdenum cofactor biosynthesis protein MoaE [Aestuariivita sp.]|nr:molybdenum cofactor biosynthesis protein MoaE [Aestuariivita sp.]MCY4202924.1 molybdenum cofactor biosynthesis protein MoaE [Aestuariivita sp.]MCY4288019.1 molybdenum cofactor biosynthesis protein MoaE [Aestuariivita sp.]MCY4346616.1 molybdenum cofactor biosynthesis protein MoaE [Aestuariivita sp.]